MPIHILTKCFIFNTIKGLLIMTCNDTKTHTATSQSFNSLDLYFSLISNLSLIRKEYFKYMKSFSFTSNYLLYTTFTK